MSATVNIPVRLDVDAEAPRFAKALAHLDNATTATLDAAGVESSLRELVRIRASQLNGCAYCIGMHTADAMQAGEDGRRLHGLVAWRETPFFSERERAALALTESITLVAQTHVPRRDYDAAAEHFSPGEMAALVSLIVTINAWNATGVATRTWGPSSYDAEQA